MSHFESPVNVPCAAWRRRHPRGFFALTEPLFGDLFSIRKGGSSGSFACLFTKGYGAQCRCRSIKSFSKCLFQPSSNCYWNSPNHPVTTIILHRKGVASISNMMFGVR